MIFKFDIHPWVLMNVCKTIRFVSLCTLFAVQYICWFFLFSTIRSVDVFQRAGQGDLDANDLNCWLRYVFRTTVQCTVNPIESLCTQAVIQWNSTGVCVYFAFKRSCVSGWNYDSTLQKRNFSCRFVYTPPTKNVKREEKRGKAKGK